jgi:glutathione S-transferase
VVLYQYEVCPWCNKVKAVLDYQGVPYRTVEVHPLFKSELSWSEYKKVPVLLLPSGEQINESTVIVDKIYGNHGAGADVSHKMCASFLPCIVNCSLQWAIW